MRIVTFKRIQEFSVKHTDSLKALNFWYHSVSRKEWNSFSDLKNDFGSADYIGNNRVVFNIKGNNYRLIAIISYNAKKVYIRFIGTHKEYDKIDCKTI